MVSGGGKMNRKTAGWLFFTVIAFHIVAVCILRSFPDAKDDMSIAFSLLAGELIIGIPSLCFLIMARRNEGRPVTSILGFKKIRIGTALLMIVAGLCLIPIGSFVNLISMLIVRNMVTESAAEVLEYPFIAVILCVGVIGPLIEEMACRGLIFSGMRKDMSALGAILLSALAFGMIHMNINQFLYAFVLGFFFAMAVEATGSIWPSVIMHMVINTEQMCKMKLASILMPGIYSSSMITDLSKTQILMSAGLYLVLGGVFTCAAVGLIVLASKLEGRDGVLLGLTEKKGDGRILTPQYIVATILAIAFMIVYEIILVKS